MDFIKKSFILDTVPESGTKEQETEQHTPSRSQPSSPLVHERIIHFWINYYVINVFFPFHTWANFSFLISRMEIINKFDKTRVDILNFRRESFIVKDHMSL